MASNTPNLQLYKKDPVTDGADVFNIETMLNENWDKIDSAVTAINETLSSYASGKDSNGKYTTIEWKRKDGTLFKKSVLSELVGDNYTVQTITWYDTNGTSVTKTEVYDLTYDEDGFPVNEVKR